MAESLPSGAEWARNWLRTSPFGQHLGMRLERLERDLAVMVLPFQPALATLGSLVHGGAIGALIDTAATAAAWSGAEVGPQPRGATASMTVNYLAGGQGEDLTATARVTKRGRSLCFCAVDVTGAKGGLVAQGVITYKLG